MSRKKDEISREKKDKKTGEKTDKRVLKVLFLWKQHWHCRFLSLPLCV